MLDDPGCQDVPLHLYAPHSRVSVRILAMKYITDLTCDRLNISACTVPLGKPSPCHHIPHISLIYVGFSIRVCTISLDATFVHFRDSCIIGSTTSLLSVCTILNGIRRSVLARLVKRKRNSQVCERLSKSFRRVTSQGKDDVDSIVCLISFVKCLPSCIVGWYRSISAFGT